MLKIIESIAEYFSEIKYGFKGFVSSMILVALIVSVVFIVFYDDIYLWAKKDVTSMKIYDLILILYIWKAIK